MLDLHIHSLLSDGALLPTEVARRYEIKGYKLIALTDHVDTSNVEDVVLNTLKVCKDINNCMDIRVIPGVELTHLPPDELGSMARYCRSKGIRVILVHGETILEPVKKGTNRKAIEAGVDILAHPGLISEEDAKLAKEKGVFLEITSRKGHSLTNGYVVQMAKKTGAKLILDNDSHVPADIFAIEELEMIAKGAGLSEEELKIVFKNSMEFAKDLVGLC